MSDTLKQVIVIRKDLNMRKGKMVTQGSHASATVIKQQFDLVYSHMFHKTVETYDRYHKFRSWLDGMQTKICVSVDSEAQLLEIYNKAQLAGLPSSLILDAGKTEFNEPTYTAVAIGPDESERINLITGELKLL